MNSQTLGLLKETRRILDDERNWTKGHLARGQSGLQERPESGEAVCWCLTGALMLACHRQVDYEGHPLPLFITATIEFTKAKKELEKSMRDLDFRFDLTHFNDSPMTEHDDILGVLDNAINKEVNGVLAT